MVNTVKKLIFVILILSAGFSLAGQKEDLKSLQNGNDIHSENIAEILPLAQKGDAQAQVKLGTMYLNGQGVPQDYRQAVYWFSKAAEQGYPVAQNNLGVMYAKGQGVSQDYQQAGYWYRKAAEQGNPLAQYNLGRMYYNGQGVPQDYKQAVYWYRKAAEQGNPEAQNNLGAMYGEGKAYRRTTNKLCTGIVKLLSRSIQ